MNNPALNASALPPLPAYKDRRGWLIAFGIFEILIACLFLFMVLMACFMALVASNLPKQPGQPAVPGVIFLVGGAFYGIIAAIFATAGIGSMRAKNWARILMIVLSSLWLAFGVMGTLGFALVMPIVLRQQEAILNQDPAMQQAQLPPNFFAIVMAISIVFQVLTMVVLPLIFLIFYTRKSVKATCERLWAPLSPLTPAMAVPPPAPSAQGVIPASVPSGPVPASAGTGLPAPVIVATIWFAIITVSGLGTALIFPLTFLFGVIIQGWEARLIVLALTAVNGFCAWNFYKLRIAGWWAAIALSAFSVLSGLVTVIRMNPTIFYGFYDDIYRRMGIDPQQVRIFMPDPRIITVFLWFGWVIAAGFFAFVVYTKRYFPANPSRT